MKEKELIKAIKEGTFFISYTYGDKSKRIGSYSNHDIALAEAEKKREKYHAKNKGGLFTVYKVSARAGRIGQEIYDVLKI